MESGRSDSERKSELQQAARQTYQKGLKAQSENDFKMAAQAYKEAISFFSLSCPAEQDEADTAFSKQLWGSLLATCLQISQSPLQGENAQAVVLYLREQLSFSLEMLKFYNIKALQTTKKHAILTIFNLIELPQLKEYCSDKNETIDAIYRDLSEHARREGQHYSKQQKFEEASESYKYAISTSRKLKSCTEEDHKIIFECFFNLSLTLLQHVQQLHNQCKFPQAITVLQEGIQIFEGIPDTPTSYKSNSLRMIILCYHRIGQQHQTENQLDEAIKAYRIIVEYSSRIKQCEHRTREDHEILLDTTSRLTHCAETLGDNFFKIRALAQARTYFEFCIDALRESFEVRALLGMQRDPADLEKHKMIVKKHASLGLIHHAFQSRAAAAKQPEALSATLQSLLKAAESAQKASVSTTLSQQPAALKKKQKAKKQEKEKEKFESREEAPRLLSAEDATSLYTRLKNVAEEIIVSLQSIQSQIDVRCTVTREWRPKIEKKMIALKKEIAAWKEYITVPTPITLSCQQELIVKLRTLMEQKTRLSEDLEKLANVKKVTEEKEKRQAKKPEKSPTVVTKESKTPAPSPAPAARPAIKKKKKGGTPAPTKNNLLSAAAFFRRQEAVPAQSKEKDEKKYSSAKKRQEFLNVAFDHLIQLGVCQTHFSAEMKRLSEQKEGDVEEYQSLYRDIRHYALLHAITRFAQMLRMYKAFGGQTELSKESMEDLRNMIIHGAWVAEEKVILSTAQKLTAMLPEQFLQMRRQEHSRIRALSAAQISELLCTYDLLKTDDRIRFQLCPFPLILENTALYRQLAYFHSTRLNDMLPAQAFELLETKFIPLIKKFMAPIRKVYPAKEYLQLAMSEKIQKEFFFHVDALRMLSEICGELGKIILNQERQPPAWFMFLRQCSGLRYEIGHERMPSSVNELFNACDAAHTLPPIGRATHSPAP